MIDRPLEAPTSMALIPIDDPAAALHFCRALAQRLAPERAPAPDREFPALSVVIPVYEEEVVLPVLHQRLTKAWR